MLKAPHSHLSSFTTNASIAAAGFGTTVISSGTTNTYGNWTQIHAGLTFPAEYFTVMLSNNFTTVTTQNAYVDIGIGASSGAVMPLIEKLCGSHAAAGLGRHYFIPIRIPPNTPIWARHQNTTSTRSISVLLSTFGGSRNPYNFPNFPRAEALGAVTATTTGTIITPGASAEGAWTQIVASTTQDYGGFIVSGMFNVDTTMTANLVTAFDIGVGASGQEITLGENVLLNMQIATDERVTSIAFPTLGAAPAGSRLVVRASGNTTPDVSNSVILLGLTN